MPEINKLSLESRISLPALEGQQRTRELEAKVNGLIAAGFSRDAALIAVLLSDIQTSLLEIAYRTGCGYDGS